MAEDNHIYIDGFGIGNYRSFGEEIQYVGPLSKVNIFVGRNNVGKSNILTFVTEQLPRIRSNIRARQVKGADAPLGKKVADIPLVCYWHPTPDGLEDILKRRGRAVRINPSRFRHIEYLQNSQTLSQDSDGLWFTLDHSLGSNGLYVVLSVAETIIEEISEVNKANKTYPHDYHYWEQIGNLLGIGGGRVTPERVARLLAMLAPSVGTDKPVHLIPTFRQVRPSSGTTAEMTFDGIGLRDHLARLERPTIERRTEDRPRWNRLIRFLQNVTGHSDAMIRIPADGDEIAVEIDGRELPLRSLGTGIHQVVILAAAGTVNENKILCIEEPELHLHPILQKKLIYYLERETSNQYFITTHSAHIIDLPNIAAFHVQHDGQHSSIQKIATPHGRFEAAADLGYRASDIVQTNCVIWVEGPSDRIYLNYWIGLVDPHLIEGVHYSIMFYGGKLLSHLSGKDEIDTSVENFIELLRLNRNAIIVMDSDREKKGKKIGATKQRVRKEFEERGYIAWVTDGREIENYVDPDVMECAVKKVYPRALKVLSKDKYAHTYKYLRNDRQKIVKGINKIAIANEIVANDSTDPLSVLDLGKQIRAIVRYVNRVNDAFEIALPTSEGLVEATQS